MTHTEAQKLTDAVLRTTVRDCKDSPCPKRTPEAKAETQRRRAARAAKLVRA